MNDDIDELTIIAAEQRRELIMAGAVESDLELAYRLQLEEAMAASLAFQPNSSSQPPKPPSPMAIDDGVVQTLELQTLELDKFATEIKDRMIIETEKKKLQVDYNRRIHDQKLAREILQMPEEEWIVVGDKLERPYGEGSSSSNREDDEDEPETLRVYFKGLLSEERVHNHGPSSSNKTVTMAGIGVAICDSRDEIVFEVRKPLELVKGHRFSRQSVEGDALVEALNAAITLDLKRIVICCDYYPLYQYVS